MKETPVLVLVSLTAALTLSLNLAAATPPGLRFAGAAYDYGLDAAKDVAIAPDGHHIYAVGQAQDALSVLERDAETGALTFVEKHQDETAGVEGMSGAEAVAISPDGRSVYVAAKNDGDIVVFERHPASGALTHLENHNAGQYAASVVDSPDGHSVYVAAETADSVTHFARDATTGRLTFKESLSDGTSQVPDGLDGAISVVVSPDGENVYVGSREDDAVCIFERASPSGELVYAGHVRNGLSGIEAMDDPIAVLVSSDGRRVYVASQNDDAVVAFERSLSDGDLTFLEMEQNGVDGAHGLATANGLALSPGGNHLYVSGYDDNAVALFSTRASVYLPVIIRQVTSSQRGD